MGLLLFGLILFLGIHSIRVFAPDFRDEKIRSMGEGRWKGIYSLISIIGLGVLVYGYSIARVDASEVFEVPAWSRILLYLAMPIALTLFVASQLPAGYLKRATRHPMLISIVIWAVAHLIANGDLASVVLFLAMLIWAFIDLKSAWTRKVVAPVHAAWWPDVVSIVAGIGLTWLFIRFVHEWLIGVAIV